MSSSESGFRPLIHALLRLPPNEVYENASKRTILNGFKLYLDKSVTGIAWIEGQEALTVNVSRQQRVKIALSGLTLSFACNCGTASPADGSPSERCSHVVCALLTIINLLTPKVFRMTTEDPQYRSLLLSGLLPGSSGPAAHSAASPQLHAGREENQVAPVRPIRPVVDTRPVYQVVIEHGKEGISWYIERNGEPVDPSMDARVPYDLGLLTGRSISYYDHDSPSRTLAHRLSAAGARYPIVFRAGNKNHAIRLVEAIPCRTWSEIDLTDGKVRLSRACTLGKENAPTKLLGDLALDLANGRFRLVDNRDGWALWDILLEHAMKSPRLAGELRASRDSAAFSLSLEDFQSIWVALRKGGPDALCKTARFHIDGKVVSPGRLHPPLYRIRIEEAPGMEGWYVLIPECMADRTVFTPLNGVFSLLRDLEREGIPKSLKTGKRKARIVDLYLKAAQESVDKAPTAAFQAALGRAGLLVGAAMHQERSLVIDRVGKLKLSAFRFLLTAQGWSFVAIDRNRETLTSAIPHEIFGPAIFDHTTRYGDAMAVSLEDLAPRLQTLRARLKEKGLDLIFNDLPLAPVTWEFTLDATGTGIDWFEIRPEIRCKGKPIERGVWEQALKRKGLIVRNGAMEILDEESLAKLSQILGLTGTGKAAARREIVSLPRLRIIELLLLRKAGIMVRLSPEDERVLQRLTDMTSIDEVPLPGGLRGELRPYQREGYYWLSFLYEHRFGACLADDMGLGKTLQAIAFLGSLKEGKLSAASGEAPAQSLIVVPPSLIFNWEQEIERFYPRLKVCVYRGSGRTTDFAGYDVVLTSYGLVRRDIDRLKEVAFSAIVFDEAQAVKNIVAGTTGAVRQLRARFKVALTGTPVENHMGEYYSIIDLVLPGLLGEHKEFGHRAKHEAEELIRAVVGRTKPFVLRRTKEAILKELPPKIERDVYLDLTEKQKRFYNRTVAEVRGSIEEAYRNKAAGQARIIALTAIMKLRQICLTPQLLVSDMKEESPKIEFLEEKIGELLSEHHSTLVFSQFTSFLDLVEERLRAKSIPLFRLDGSTPVIQRKAIVTGFQESADPAVFLLSLKAGGQGLNLTRASYVFHLDPWWNPAVENQASDRAHRIGQKNSVIITRILMRHTVEEKMMELKRRKMSLYRALLESPEKAGPMSITKEDFDYLLG